MQAEQAEQEEQEEQEDGRAEGGQAGRVGGKRRRAAAAAQAKPRDPPLLPPFYLTLMPVVGSPNVQQDDQQTVKGGEVDTGTGSCDDDEAQHGEDNEPKAEQQPLLQQASSHAASSVLPPLLAPVALQVSTVDLVAWLDVQADGLDIVDGHGDGADDGGGPLARYHSRLDTWRKIGAARLAVARRPPLVAWRRTGGVRAALPGYLSQLPSADTVRRALEAAQGVGECVISSASVTPLLDRLRNGEPYRTLRDGTVQGDGVVSADDQLWPAQVRVAPAGDDEAAVRGDDDSSSDDSEFLFATQGAEDGCWLVWHGIVPLLRRDEVTGRARRYQVGPPPPPTRAEPTLYLLHSRDARIVRGAGDWLLARHFRWHSPLVSVLHDVHDLLHASYVAASLAPLWRLTPAASAVPPSVLPLFLEALRVPRRRKSAKERERERRAAAEDEAAEEAQADADLDGWAHPDRATQHDREHDQTRSDYERLEHLGDLVLGAAVAMAVFHRDSSAAEGSLSSTRAMYVSNAALGALSLALSLDSHVLFRTRAAFLRDLRGGRTTGIATSSKVWADAYEAVVGATFMAVHHSLASSPVDVLPAAHALIAAHAAVVSDEVGVVPPSLRSTTLAHSRAVLVAQAPLPHPLALAEADCVAVESILGYHFANRGLLADALTHSSVATAGRSYERWEFLGDSVLNLIVGFALFQCSDPSRSPPAFATVSRAALLHTAKAMLVNNTTLGRATRETGLAAFARVSEEATTTSMVGERLVPRWAGDIFESLVGAAFVDSHHDAAVVARLIWRLLPRGLLLPDAVDEEVTGALAEAAVAEADGAASVDERAAAFAHVVRTTCTWTLHEAVAQERRDVEYCVNPTDGTDEVALRSVRQEFLAREWPSIELTVAAKLAQEIWLSVTARSAPLGDGSWRAWVELCHGAVAVGVCEVEAGTEVDAELTAKVKFVHGLLALQDGAIAASSKRKFRDLF